VAIATLKGIDLKDENKDINVVIVDSFFKINLEIITALNCGMNTQNINKHIKNCEKSTKKVQEQYQDN
jgi:hypothetical protein